MMIEIRKKSFNAYAEIKYYLDSLNIAGEYGASSNFVGSMRDFNKDKKVTQMTLEHYPEMTEKYLETNAMRSRFLFRSFIHRDLRFTGFQSTIDRCGRSA